MSKKNPVGTTVFERHRPPESTVRQSLDGTRQSVFWLDDLGAQRARPPLTGERRADLVVIGGGYTGLWTALLAKRRDPDAHVVLLEGRTIGWAASGRNGGFVEASLTHGRENGLNRWPEEYDALERLGLANLDAIESDLAAWGVDAEFIRTGSLAVATEPHQLAWLAEEAETTDDTVVHLDERAVRAMIDSPTYLGATWDTRGSATVHPAKLAFGLARAAEEHGVDIHEGSLVRGIESSTASGTVRLQTETGSVVASRVALATNAFRPLLRRNALMTVPVYDYVLMTEPLSEVQLAAIGWTDRQGVSDIANQFHYYRLSADNRILWGGYDAVYHFGGRIRAGYENRPETFSRLASHFFTTFPQLEGLRFTHRWAGVIDTSTQFSAFYGLARRGRVAYTAGFTGLGVAATRFAAETMLDLLGGEATERTSLAMVRKRPLPFPPEPATAVGVNMTRWALDKADHNGGKRNLLLRTLDAVGLGFDS
jgi:glycine/D-amino acid oxidase-like deaminating enzyme